MEPIQLNENWRVSADAAQWLLQARRKSKRSPWATVSFCATREGLRRNIWERKIVITEEAQQQLYGLPYYYDPRAEERRIAKQVRLAEAAQRRAELKRENE